MEIAYYLTGVGSGVVLILIPEILVTVKNFIRSREYNNQQRLAQDVAQPSK